MRRALKIVMSFFMQATLAQARVRREGRAANIGRMTKHASPESFRIPDGFREVPLRNNPFLDRVGPLYGRLDGDQFVLGFAVLPQHCNPGGTCHGGMMMTLSDMLLILGSNVAARVARYFVTVSVNNDFLGPAPEGAWIEGRAEVLRVTRSFVFSQGLFTHEGNPILRTSGILKPTGDEDPRFDPRRWLE